MSRTSFFSALTSGITPRPGNGPARPLHTIQDQLTGKDVRLVITGSAGLGVAKAAGIDFVQEVYATAAAVNTYIPGTDAVIELGWRRRQDHLFGGALGGRMNGSCSRRHRRLHRADGDPSEGMVPTR